MYTLHCLSFSMFLLPGLTAMGLLSGSFNYILEMGCGVYVAQYYNVCIIKKLFNTYVFLAKHIEFEP
jgi:hypothetical protein